MSKTPDEIQQSPVFQPRTCPRAGLVVIDAQRLFLDPLSPARVTDPESVISNSRLLASLFLTLGLPVLFTRHVEPDTAPRGTLAEFFPHPLSPSDPMSVLAPDFDDLTPLTATMDKDSHDAFSRGLHPSFTNVTTLYLTGVRTPLCVLATALGLARFGITPVVVHDACSARFRSDHDAALRCLLTGHARVRCTAEAMESIHSLFRRTDGR